MTELPHFKLWANPKRFLKGDKNRQDHTTTSATENNRITGDCQRQQKFASKKMSYVIGHFIGLSFQSLVLYIWHQSGLRSCLSDYWAVA